MKFKNCKDCKVCETLIDCLWNLTHGLQFCETRFVQIIVHPNKAEKFFEGDVYSTESIIEEIDELRAFLKNDDFLCHLFLHNKYNKLKKMRKPFNDDKLLNWLLLEEKIVL